jgi:hypothetical protein
MGTFNITANVILHQKQNMKVFFLVNRVFGQKFIKKNAKKCCFVSKYKFLKFLSLNLCSFDPGLKA